MFFEPRSGGAFWLLPFYAEGTEILRLWYLLPLTLELPVLLQFRQLWHVGALKADGVVWLYHRFTLYL